MSAQERSATSLVSPKKGLLAEDKLDALRKGDPDHPWLSLDDCCACTCCQKTFSGRQIEVSTGPGGRVVLQCPTEGCAGTPREWIQPGNRFVAKTVAAKHSPRRALEEPPVKSI